MVERSCWKEKAKCQPQYKCVNLLQHAPTTRLAQIVMYQKQRNEMKEKLLLVVALSFSLFLQTEPCLDRIIKRS